MFPFRFCLCAVGIIAMLTTACTRRHTTIIPSYYYWSTSGIVYDDQRQLIRKHAIHTIYAKILDIDWAGVSGAIPVASMNIHDFHRQLNYYDSLGVQTIPVVFITNKTFAEIDSLDIPLLAKRIVRRCLPGYDSADRAYEARDYLYERSHSGPHEIQIDCDWTKKTAPKYFYFLDTLRKLLPSDTVHLSATIRLHQYKYRDKTGVPPVDRGMLMMYNVNDLTQYSPVNSIFQKDKAQAYFTRNDSYPLPLDIALPAYSWGLVFRNRKFYQIENQLDNEELSGKIAFQRESSANGVSFYRVTKDTVMGELFLRPGDEIKIESIDSIQLHQAADLARQAFNTDTFRISLFDISSNEIKRFSDETLSDIYHPNR